MSLQPSKVDNLKAFLGLYREMSTLPTPSDFKALISSLGGVIARAKDDLLRELRVHTGRMDMEMRDMRKEHAAHKKECKDMISKGEMRSKEDLRREVSKLQDEIDNLPDIDQKLMPYAKASSVTSLMERLGSLRESLKQYATNSRVDALEKRMSDMSSRPTGRVMGMRKVPIVRSINLSDQLNGVTKSFLLPKDTVRVLGVWGTQFPITFNSNEDFTLTGNTLTLTSEVSAPEAGQTLFCLVETLFYA